VAQPGRGGRDAPVGILTRGTTNPNRLRRVDRFCAGPLASALWRAEERPVVVDLGYGASPVTAVELHTRLRRIRPDVRLAGLEISPERVAAAAPWASENRVFSLGGFEVPLPAGWTDPVLIRAFNVLRQYDEASVPDAWALLTSRLAPGGVLVEGTCDEVGRLASWVTLDAAGPRLFTVSVRLRDLERPGEVAERLPKALIHHNVPGQPVHAWLSALDRAWTRAAPVGVRGPRPRWLATVEGVKEAGWPVQHGPGRWRLGEVTVPWDAVAATGCGA
jgi:hypothetical protein